METGESEAIISVSGTAASDLEAHSENLHTEAPRKKQLRLTATWQEVKKKPQVRQSQSRRPPQ